MTVIWSLAMNRLIKPAKRFIRKQEAIPPSWAWLHPFPKENLKLHESIAKWDCYTGKWVLPK